MVYFLLVELLEFLDLGRYEKVAWSVPVQAHDHIFLVEHRKMGLGVFARSAEREEEIAREVVAGITRAVKIAQPFFDWKARQAVEQSRVNVLNRSRPLFERFDYLRWLYRERAEEARARKDERTVEKRETRWGSSTTVTMPAFQIRREAGWLALATIEAFFAWTEHIFIHLSILTGRVSSGIEVAQVAESDWPDKFRRAFDLRDPETKDIYDKLVTIRREVRNFMAHGAFGKQGEAFQFHSGAGAVPVLLPHRAGSRAFRLGGGIEFEHDAALLIPA